MPLTLPSNLQAVLTPIFEALPFEEAMPTLLPGAPAEKGHSLVAKAATTLYKRPDIVAGLWLYVDDLDKSHNISQTLETKTGSLWHAIVHRREGDFWNSKYWLRRALPHPALMGRRDLDPVDLVDDVSMAGDKNPASLLETQRKEWLALFEWCVNQRESS